LLQEKSVPARIPPPHPVKSIEPPLEVLGRMGFGRRACLKGTGIMLAQLDRPESRLTFQQEIAFYRNALQLSGDKAIGLRLGEPFIPQRYGLIGYALLAAPTLRRAMSLAENFGQLTFSFFSFEFGEKDGLGWFAMKDPPAIEDAVHDVYLDRDMSAAVVDFSALMGRSMPLQAVHLAHDGHGCAQRYRQHFGCEVRFSSYPSKLVFEASLLDEPLPQGDRETSRYFRQQCQMLIAKLESQSHFTDDVRMILLARPGEFPTIEQAARRLHMSTRTLRRKLSKEGCSFKSLLNEVRYRMAREYLEETRLPISEISWLLGYTEPGNFSHAFRRWNGASPRDYRGQHQAA
jgi:AraC-like DNA-binding protein